MKHIRQARVSDAFRIAEIIVFNYRLIFYPIFRNDEFYFNEIQVKNVAREYEDPDVLWNTYVYDDGTVKGMIRIEDGEIKKLFVEPVLQNFGMGKKLLCYGTDRCGAHSLWVLEKNERAISFYKKNGFSLTGEKKREEGTEEYLLRMEKIVADTEQK